MLFNDENSNEGIKQVMEEIQPYVPCYGEGKLKVGGHSPSPIMTLTFMYKIY
jgi:hypothetical protein